MRLPGSLAARFEVLGPLGSGGYGTVLRVLSRSDGTERALKLLESRDEPGRLAREIEASTRVRHSRVVRCFEGGLAAGQAYLVLELADGTLEPWLEGPEPDPRAWEALRQACEGVDALHAEGLVHRDLKPSNILLFGDQAKISDLGLTKGGDLATVTQAGLILGTPGYLAPEQARGGRSEAASDIFALAVMFHEALGGGLPYPGGRDPVSVMKAVTAGRVTPDPRALSRLTPAAAAALTAALEVEPGRRPSNAFALAEALAAAPAPRTAAVAATTVLPRADPRQAATQALDPGGRAAPAAGPDLDDTPGATPSPEDPGTPRRPPRDGAASRGAGVEAPRSRRLHSRRLAGGGPITTRTRRRAVAGRAVAASLCALALGALGWRLTHRPGASPRPRPTRPPNPEVAPAPGAARDAWFTLADAERAQVELAELGSRPVAQPESLKGRRLSIGGADPITWASRVRELPALKKFFHGLAQGERPEALPEPVLAGLRRADIRYARAGLVAPYGPYITLPRATPLLIRADLQATRGLPATLEGWSASAVQAMLQLLEEYELAAQRLTQGIPEDASPGLRMVLTGWRVSSVFSDMHLSSFVREQSFTSEVRTSLAPYLAPGDPLLRRALYCLGRGLQEGEPAIERLVAWTCDLMDLARTHMGELVAAVRTEALLGGEPTTLYGKMLMGFVGYHQVGILDDMDLHEVAAATSSTTLRAVEARLAGIEAALPQDAYLLDYGVQMRETAQDFAGAERLVHDHLDAIARYPRSQALTLSRLCAMRARPEYVAPPPLLSAPCDQLATRLREQWSRFGGTERDRIRNRLKPFETRSGELVLPQGP